MTLSDRLDDADLLWLNGHREGALLSVLVAITGLARAASPTLRDGEAFRCFLRERHAWNVEVEHRGHLVSFEQLMWKWLRCELAHRGAMPVDVQFFRPEPDPDDLRIQAGGAPDYCVRISDGWFWWLRRQAQDALDAGAL